MSHFNNLTLNTVTSLISILFCYSKKDWALNVIYFDQFQFCYKKKHFSQTLFIIFLTETSLEWLVCFLGSVFDFYNFIKRVNSINVIFKCLNFIPCHSFQVKLYASYVMLQRVSVLFNSVSFVCFYFVFINVFSQLSVKNYAWPQNE